MAPNSERFELRLDENLLQQIDMWRSAEAGMPSRSDAVRQLVLRGLGRNRTDSVSLSDGERLIMSMLCDLMRANDVKENFDPEKVQAALYGGHLWSLKWEHTWLLGTQDDNYDDVKHVVDTLDMWRFIESAHARMSSKDKKALAEAVPYRGSNPRFAGYDGHTESRFMGIAHHIIHDLGRFGSFKKHDLDSHHPTVERYAAMLRIFTPLRAKIADGKELGLDELMAILSADD